MPVQSHTAILTIALLLWAGVAQSASPQQPIQREQKLKEQLIDIPAGAVVVVRLENRQKLRGRLGAVTDMGFDLQTMRDGRIVTSTLRFDQVQSIKHHKGVSTGAKIAIAVLGGIVAFVLIVVAIAAAHGWYFD